MKVDFIGFARKNVGLSLIDGFAETVEQLVRDYLPQLADAPRDATRP